MVDNKIHYKRHPFYVYNFENAFVLNIHYFYNRLLTTTPIYRFEETGSEWLLQQRPQGVLTALVDMAVSYNTQLQEQGTQKVFQGRLSQGSDTIFSQLPILMIALYKIAW